MDFGTYFAELTVAERLRELRAAAARRALLREASPGGRPGLRARLGQALIRIGQRLAAPVEPGAQPGGLAQGAVSLSGHEGAAGGAGLPA